MNQAFQFAVEAYSKAGGVAKVLQVVTTGSQETRARRRVLEGLHAAGLFARSVTLVASKPVRELDGGCEGK